ncbi:hypothetical protein Ppa06_42000 [Planomonospora parontospora subsp. parontospora]|uniref:DUF72 domain-containing protein n=2 Tax=Planomonospora parontospora TaxID=58119 RepID=A0AA37BK66_9ACTN|nr:DUF72 domain-containing protein [Planomonospora parontospora]GGK82944.1 hypothetical protein GCM10010126_47860 [Planomonospora parontospora]GII10402.1 hypothetical protein Ppa06_42000 [Planomonospora parontospora subsp. parontospora]
METQTSLPIPVPGPPRRAGAGAAFPAGAPAGNVLVGTASWTDRSLLDSGWYPDGVSTPAERLAFYAARFPLVEVDATYYHPPSVKTAEAWRDRTPPGFTFNVKAFSLLTGHPTRARSLYKDLRLRLGDPDGTLYLRDVGPEIAEEVWSRFLGALAPLHEAGRLGAVLLQFPPWFPAGEGNRRRVLESVRRCAPMRACVEFRNRTWMEEGERERTLGFLAEHGIPYVSVDMPQGHPSSIPPVLAATADLAVVRFHGHSDKWTSKKIEERFAYAYSEAELERWAARLREFSGQAGTVHVLMNNCCRDNAQRNAARLTELLGASPAGERR